MGVDPLYDPLGHEPAPASKAAGRRPRLIGALAVLAVLLAAGGVFIFHGGQLRDETVAVAPIEPAPKEPPPAAAAPLSPAPVPAQATAVAAPTAGPVAQPNGDTIEIQNGVKIIRMGAASRSTGVGVAPPNTSAASPAQSLAATNPDLIEQSRFGPLPRIGANGLRPSDAYARAAAEPSNKAGAPRIALLLGGLGLDKAATALAAKRLPGAVSFGFAPDGADLTAQIGETRDAGHEAILQLPPVSGAVSFTADATGSVPSPQDPAGSLDRLHRAMGKATGYAGMVEPPGATSLADAGIARPVLRDLASRGLFLIGDAVVRGSAIGAIAPDVGLQVGNLDAVVDATGPAPLSRLEAIARAKGQALGYVTLATAGADGVARLTETLARDGFLLVPASALAKRVPDPVTSVRR